MFEPQIVLIYRSSRENGKTLAGFQFPGGHLEPLEDVPTENHRDWHITRIPAATNNYASYPAMIMASVECVPLFAKKNLKPGAEIHRVGIWRNTNVAEIARYIAGWNV